MTATLQQSINDAYPLTHTYDMAEDGPVPTGWLAKRIKIINRLAPDFFTGHRFLDVGCAQGFFAVEAAPRFYEVVAIDNDLSAITTCLRVQEGYQARTNRVQFHYTGFRDFHDHQTFDRVFVGNGPQHLFAEANGPACVAKLAALCSGLLLTEGPLDDSCRDISRDLERWGAFKDFTKHMQVWFKLVGKVSAVSYMPGRFVCLWQRKHDTVRVVSGRQRKQHVKLYCRDRYVSNSQVTVAMAAASPYSNGVTAWLPDGWMEPYRGDKPYEYNENEEHLFRCHAAHQVFLARAGYVDIDPATINWWPPNTLFDKGGVVPVCELGPQHPPVYDKLFRQSFTADFADWALPGILPALETRDPVAIEQAFQVYAGGAP